MVDSCPTDPRCAQESTRLKEESDGTRKAHRHNPQHSRVQRICSCPYIRSARIRACQNVAGRGQVLRMRLWWTPPAFLVSLYVFYSLASDYLGLTRSVSERTTIVFICNQYINPGTCGGFPTESCYNDPQDCG